MLTLLSRQKHYFSSRNWKILHGGFYQFRNGNFWRCFCFRSTGCTHIRAETISGTLGTVLDHVWPHEVGSFLPLCVKQTQLCRHEKTSKSIRFVVGTLTGSLISRGISLYKGMCNLPQLHSVFIEHAVYLNSVAQCLDSSLHDWHGQPPKTHDYLGKCRCSLVICLYFFDGIMNGVPLLVTLRNCIITDLNEVE